MPERQAEFSDYEKEQIAFYAREAARIGEDCIWSLVLAKAELCKIAISTAQNKILAHEIGVVGEVIDQARIILQVEGRDSLSELDRHAQNAGLGSVFDPDSKISQDLRSHGP